MKVTVEVPDYAPHKGNQYTWVANHLIVTSLCEKWEEPLFTIKANAAGLRSLAIQMLTLAQDSTPDGNYMIYGAEGDVEPGSIRMKIQKCSHPANESERA